LVGRGCGCSAPIPRKPRQQRAQTAQTDRETKQTHVSASKRAHIRRSHGRFQNTGSTPQTPPFHPGANGAGVPAFKAAAAAALREYFDSADAGEVAARWGGCFGGGCWGREVAARWRPGGGGVGGTWPGWGQAGGLGASSRGRGCGPAQTEWPGEPTWNDPPHHENLKAGRAGGAGDAPAVCQGAWAPHSEGGAAIGSIPKGLALQTNRQTPSYTPIQTPFSTLQTHQTRAPPETCHIRSPPCRAPSNPPSKPSNPTLQTHPPTHPPTQKQGCGDNGNGPPRPREGAGLGPPHGPPPRDTQRLGGLGLGGSLGGLGGGWGHEGPAVTTQAGRRPQIEPPRAATHSPRPAPARPSRRPPPHPAAARSKNVEQKRSPRASPASSPPPTTRCSTCRTRCTSCPCSWGAR
jgi:hypothetical protein